MPRNDDHFRRDRFGHICNLDVLAVAWSLADLVGRNSPGLNEVAARAVPGSWQAPPTSRHPFALGAAPYGWPPGQYALTAALTTTVAMVRARSGGSVVGSPATTSSTAAGTLWTLAM